MHQNPAQFASKNHAKPSVSDVVPLVCAVTCCSGISAFGLSLEVFCCKMTYLIAKSGGNKSHLSHFVAAICHDFH